MADGARPHEIARNAAQVRATVPAQQRAAAPQARDSTVEDGAMLNDRSQFYGSARAAGSVATLLICSALGAGCTRSHAEQQPNMPPPEVAVARVVSDSIQPWEEFTGRLQAVNRVDIHPRVSGFVESVQFTEGALVKKGDPLFLIDQRPFQQQVQRLDAERKRAQSQLQFAKLDYERGQRLIESQTIPRGRFEELEAAHFTALAAADSVAASLASARLDLEFTRVRAPIDGRVSRALITEGNLVSSASLLTTIVSGGDIFAYFDVDEATYLRLSRPAQGATKVQMRLADESGYPHEGRVDFFDNQVDPGTSTMRVRAIFPDQEGRLVPGLFARIRVQSGKPTSAILIDDKAVLTDQDRKYVYVLDEKNRAQRKNIALGPMFEDLRVASAGLSGKDRVIVHGVQKVFFPGMPVKPTEIAMGTPPEAANESRTR
jgi:multidrug efflux system membrane fusion protein